MVPKPIKPNPEKDKATPEKEQNRVQDSPKTDRQEGEKQRRVSQPQQFFLTTQDNSEKVIVPIFQFLVLQENERDTFIDDQQNYIYKYFKDLTLRKIMESVTSIE